VYIPRLEKAHRHVIGAQEIVARQRALIARKQALGYATEMSEELLVTFERNLTIFEEDLAMLIKRG
jgi:hypothetical protein